MSKIFFLLLGCYFLTRLASLTLLPMFNDEAIYLDWGWRETHIPGLLFYSLYDSKPPFLLWLFGIFETIFEDPLFAGRLVSVLCGFLTLFGIYSLSKKLFNTSTAIVASLLYSIVPLFVFFDRQALMESAVGAVGVWTCYFSVMLWETRKRKYAYSIGIFLGLGFMIKFSAAVYLLAYFIIALVILLKSKQKKDLIEQNSIVIGVFCVVCALLLINPEFWSTLPRNTQYSLSLSELLHFPLSSWFKNMETNFIIEFFYITPFVFLASLIGTYILLKRSTREHRLVALWFILCLVIQTLIIRTSSQRYLVAFLPLIVIPASYALHCLVAKQKILGWIGITCSFLLPAVFTLLLLSSPQTYIQFMSKLNPYSEVGYISGQTSGYGLSEVRNYLDTVSKNQKIFVGYANNTGTPESALTVYYEKNDHVVAGIFDGRDFGNALQNTDCLTFPVKFFYISRNNELTGLEKFLAKRETIHTPDSYYTLGIYTTKQPCKGKTLNLGIEK